MTNLKKLIFSLKRENELQAYQGKRIYVANNNNNHYQKSTEKRTTVKANLLFT